MILQFLKSTDKAMYRQWVQFNLDYLGEIKAYLTTNFNPEISLKNLLAKDEMDPYKVEVGKMSSKIHESLLEYIDSRIFYGQTELVVMLDVLTYLEFSTSPSLEQIHSKMAPLSELHTRNTDISTEDSVLVLAKLIYNRSRIMKLCQGTHLGLKDLLETHLDSTVDTLAAAEGICRLSGVHHALRSISESLRVTSGETADMIKEITAAMLAYRKCLISPEKMGYGEMDMSASEHDLYQKEVTPAVLENLKLALNKYKDNPVTPTDFLLCIMEAMKLSGVDLMI